MTAPATFTLEIDDDADHVIELEDDGNVLTIATELLTLTGETTRFS